MVGGGGEMVGEGEGKWWVRGGEMVGEGRGNGG